MEFLSQFDDYWFWFLVATVLLALEALLAGQHFRYLAASIAALAVGALSYFFPYVSFLIQVLFFSVFVAGFVWLAMRYIKNRLFDIEQLRNTIETKAYVGREFKLIGDISDGQGSLNVDGIVWRLEGEDCLAGEQVRIIDMAEGVLMVEPVAV